MANTKQTKWPENVKDWTSITEATANLALSQSEILLKESLDTAKSIRDKADKILTILIPSISALLIYVVTGFNSITDYLQITGLLSLVILIVALAILFINIEPYAISVPGNNAEDLLNNFSINKEDTEREQYVQLALKICGDYKVRRGNNERQNKKRAFRNKWSLKVMSIGLLTAPIIAFILRSLFRLLCL